MKNFREYILEYTDKNKDPKEESDRFLSDVVEQHRRMATNDPILMEKFPEALTLDIRNSIWHLHFLTKYPHLRAEYGGRNKYWKVLKKDAGHLLPFVEKNLGITSTPRERQYKFNWETPGESNPYGGKPTEKKPGSGYYGA